MESLIPGGPNCRKQRCRADLLTLTYRSHQFVAGRGTAARCWEREAFRPGYARFRGLHQARWLPHGDPL